MCDDFGVFILGLFIGMILLAVLFTFFTIESLETQNKLIEKACSDQYGNGDYSGSYISLDGKIVCDYKEENKYDSTDIKITKKML